MTTFPPGARVYVDEDPCQQAIVVQVFPEGSSSYSFPHYKLRPLGGTREQIFCVKIDRVGVELAEDTEYLSFEQYYRD